MCDCNAIRHDDPEYMRDAIRRNYNAARGTDAARDGLAWYTDAERVIADDAAEYGLPHSTVATVYAVCSVDATWAANRTFARKWLDYATGRKPSANRPALRYGFVTDRAEQATTERPETFEHAFGIALGKADARGSKIGSFVANFHGLEEYVTVDRWAMVGAGLATAEHNAKGRLTPCAAHSKAPKGVKYDRIADAYRDVAAEFGIAPRDLQAVVWVAVRGSAN